MKPGQAVAAAVAVAVVGASEEGNNGSSSGSAVCRSIYRDPMGLLVLFAAWLPASSCGAGASNNDVLADPPYG